MVEFKTMSSRDERELRTWCFKQVWPRLYDYQFDKALELSERLYDFVTGKIGGLPRDVSAGGNKVTVADAKVNETRFTVSEFIQIIKDSQRRAAG